MFRVWSSVVVVVVALSLAKAAPAATPQDCESLTRPLTLDNPAKFAGRWNLIEQLVEPKGAPSRGGMQSSWINITPSAEDNRTLIVDPYVRIRGSCYGRGGRENFTIVSDTHMTADKTDVISLVSTCDNCLLLHIIARTSPGSPLNLLLHARGRSLNETDLEVFHQQAKCLNFTMPPLFHYDGEQEFCPEVDNMEATEEKAEGDAEKKH